jgi:NAD(P)-dependent dehydrogenase (short-subunit alcohol dehydrogenase family)
MTADTAPSRMILVTGATDGLGRELASSLAQDGAPRSGLFACAAGA